LNLKKNFSKAQDLFRIGDIGAAKKITLAILRKFPQNFDALNFLAFLESQLKNPNAAIETLKKIQNFFPNHVQTFSNLGVLYMEIGQFEAAIENFQKAINLDQKNPSLQFNLGKALFEKKDYEKAKRHYEIAIKLDDNYFDAYLNLGFTYNIQGHYKEACKIYEKLLSKKPDYNQAYSNLAAAYANMHNFKKAIEFYKKCITLEPENFSNYYALGCVYLFTKNFLEGWKYYDYRWKINQLKPSFTKYIPECESFDNDEKILIWDEQGLGDQIIYSSILTSLKQTQNYTITLDERLIPIYKRSFPNFKFENLKDISNFEEFDSQISLGSLGKFFRNSDDSFSREKDNFLSANKKKAEKYKQKLTEKNKLICGISWKSSAKEGEHRSLDISELLPLLCKKNITFVDLQYGDTEPEKTYLKKIGIELKSISMLDKFNDLDDLFSLIEACDFVVTTDNVTAHFAGAIGKKTYLLAPYRIGLIWYWPEDKSLWYPSITVLRQKKLNLWKDVVEDLVEKINF